MDGKNGKSRVRGESWAKRSRKRPPTRASNVRMGSERASIENKGSSVAPA